MATTTPLESPQPSVLPDGSPSLPRASRGIRREVLGTCAAVGIVALFCVTLLGVDRSWFWKDDYQNYQLAGFRDMYRAWSEGEFPLLSPYSWQCTALAGEYQFGVFSIFITGCILAVFSLGLPLPYAAAAISITHICVLGAGTYRLTRSRGLPMESAMLAVVVTALSGWVMVWGAQAWAPGLLSFAWVPWFWWGLEFAARRPGSLRAGIPAGLVLYLVVTAGWPFSVLMCALLTAWVGLKSIREQKRIGVAAPLVLTWIVGMGLSAPAWMMLIEYYGATNRSVVTELVQGAFLVPIDALPGLIFPNFPAQWANFRPDYLHESVELTGGFLVVVILITAMRRLGSEATQGLRWEIWLTIMVLVLAMIPGLANFRWSFRWLPLFALAMGILGSHLHARIASRDIRLSTTAIVIFVPVLILAFLRAPEYASRYVPLGGTTLLILVIWALVERSSWGGATLRRWAPCCVVLATSWLPYAMAKESMDHLVWSMDQVAARPSPDEDVRYLGVFRAADVLPPQPGHPNDQAMALVAGNTGMYDGIETVHGYSPMCTRELTDLFHFQTWGAIFPMDDPDPAGHAKRIIEQETAPDGLLATMGVDGLILPKRFLPYRPALEANGWSIDGEPGEVTFFLRDKPTKRVANSVTQASLTGDYDEALKSLRERDPNTSASVVLTSESSATIHPPEYSTAEIYPIASSRNRVTVKVDNTRGEQPALVAFQRPILPGYRAHLNDEPLTIKRYNLSMPAVEVPPGSNGEVVLEYRPRSLVVGSWLAGLTLLMMGLVMGAALFSSRK